MQHWCEKYARPAIFKRQTAENIFHRRCCRPSRATPYKQLRSYITWYFAWMKFCTAKQKYDIRHSAIQHARRYQYHSKDRKSRQDLDPQGNRTKRSNALLTKLVRYRNYAWSYLQVVIQRKTFSITGGFGNGLHLPSETHKVHSTILHAQICYDYAWAAFRRWCNNSWRPFLGNKKGQSVEHPFFSNYCITLKRNQIDMNHKKTRKMT